MMAMTLISAMFQRGIVIQKDGDELVLSGNTDTLQQADIVSIKENKAELLTLLDEGVKGMGVVFQSQVTEQSYSAPVSNLQRNIYFLESLAEGQNFYNVPVAFRLKGEVNEQALAQALASVCQQFHILRTVYQTKGYELVQVVEPFELAKLPFEVQQIKAVELGTLLREQANHHFDLANSWPIKAVLFKTEQETVLSLNLHHIAIDGYSAKLITDAISDAYRHHCSQGITTQWQSDSKVYSAPQYADYAYWHQDYLMSPACQQARNYWSELLKGAPSCNNFPLENRRPSTLSVEGDVLYHSIEGPLFDKIKQASANYNTTPFLFLQAMFAGFMGRLGDEEDLVISSVYANRSPSVFMNTIGMFANTIPFRYRFDQQTDPAHLVANTISQHKNALNHQHYPFELMLEGLNIDRDPSYNPLVQMQFVLQEDALADFTLEGLEVESLNNRQAVAKFDFSVHVYVRQQSIKIQWEYNTNLFSEQRLKALLALYLEFVGHHIDNQFDKVLMYRFDDMAQANQVSKANFAPYKSNPEIIEQYARSQPLAIAVVDGERTLSYEALIAKGECLIAGLQQQGVAYGERVAVYMEKSIEQVIAMYAVMRGGFTYVPMDPSYPEERLAYICENSQAKALLHAESFVPSNDIAGSTPLLSFEQLLAAKAKAKLQNIDEAQPAYIIYTSGSTGKPKGVVVPNGSIYYSLQANRQVYDFCAEDAMPTVGSQAFGVSLLETFVPLISGGTVQTLQKGQVADIAALCAATQESTIIHMVPSLMAQWLDQIENNTSLYPKLRLLLVGAEPVPPILLERLKVWRSDVVVRVLYGMTESSVVSSGYLSDEHDGKGYSVGKPHPNMKFYTMNRFGVPQPVGVPGELYVGGLSLAAGYVGLPEMTAEKFAHHKHLGERLYKTGDRARLQPSGHFEFLGRVDHQVSLRGIRIETGEIEALVNKIEAVKKCIAHVMPLDNGDSKFVLYFTKYGDIAKAELVEQIKAVLAKSIPESMRPSIFVELEVFPHNPNGKVDRKKLPKPTSESTFVGPESDTEQFLYQQWCEMLELEQLSVLDNFFELGGHSLMATKLISKINEQYGIALPLKRFFEAANIRDSAKVIDEEVESANLGKMLSAADGEALDGEIDEFVI